MTDYYTQHKELLPPKGAYVNIHAELMSYFARNLWRKIWEHVGPENANIICESEDECDAFGRLTRLSHIDGSGEVTIDDIHYALSDMLGLSVDEKEKSLAKFIHNFADTSGDGKVTLEDLQTFCSEMPALYENDSWRLKTERRVV